MLERAVVTVLLHEILLHAQGAGSAPASGTGAKRPPEPEVKSPIASGQLYVQRGELLGRPRP